MSKGTPMRYVRMTDALWSEFQAATTKAGVNASEIIRGLVREWIRKQNEDMEGEK